MSTLTSRRCLALSAGALALIAFAQPGAAHAGEPVPPGATATAEDAHHAGSGLAALTARSVAPQVKTGLRGLDVSAYQGNVNWSAVRSGGASFAYVKATEGLTYKNAYFSQQYNGSAAAGLLRGAYHFARPENSGGAAQADNFVNQGGGWKKDGKTLPGALDIEYSPVHGAPACYGLGQSQMVGWIGAFVDRYHARTGRYPVIYTTTDWWSKCTGNTAAFAKKSPLWIANFNGSPRPLPHGWSGYAIWQTAEKGPFPGDQDVFNGSLQDLKKFANGDYSPPTTPDWPAVQQGQSGPQVTAAQYLLNSHGSSLNVDGQFGSGTRDAVIAFQNANHLTADGVIGPNTWKALVVTTQSGASGPAVKAVQSLLNSHGSSLNVDGQFGGGTRDAVIAFQNANHLTADGVIGPNTWLALLS